VNIARTQSGRPASRSREAADHDARAKSKQQARASYLRARHVISLRNNTRRE
jgi:hypothetical protein